MDMRKIDFIGIGAQKAGTSWIHACLYEHPDIFMPATKELHFFSNYYANGWPWYAAHFHNLNDHERAGEFSPTYLYHPEAPKRIFDYHARIKLLVCLRDPVERTVSAYRYALQTGVIPPTMTLDTVIHLYPAYVEHSLYFAQIERYLKYFSPDQLLVMLYEDIAGDADGFMRQIYQFLEVPTSFRAAMTDQRVNASRGVPRLSAMDHLMRGLAARLRRAGLSHLVWRLGRSRTVQALRQLNTRPVDLDVLSDRQRAHLQRRFAPDVRALSDLLQRDLRQRWFGDLPLELSDDSRPAQGA